jgi:simple sugar transport system permease protein
LGGARLAGGSGFVGNADRHSRHGPIQTGITFHRFFGFWTKILIGLLLFAFILLRKGFSYLSKGGRRFA